MIFSSNRCVINSLISHILGNDFFYPWACRVCQGPTDRGCHLCRLCQPAFTLLPVERGCLFCGAGSEPICITCSLTSSPWYSYACWRLSFPYTRMAKEAIRGRLAPLFSDVLFLQHHRLGWPKPHWILFDGPQEGAAYGRRLASLLHCHFTSLYRAYLRCWIAKKLSWPSFPEGQQILILRTMESSREIMEKDLHDWGGTHQVRFLSLVRTCSSI